MKTLLTGLTACLFVTAARAAVFTYAEYHLGESGSFNPGYPHALNSNGFNRHFNYLFGDNQGFAISNSTAPNASGSTASSDTSAPHLQGCGMADFFQGAPPLPLVGLPQNNFAFGIFARAAQLGASNTGNVFSLGSSSLQLSGQGWRAQVAPDLFIPGQSGTFTPNTWVHLALIRTNNETRFYIDGVDQGNPSTTEPRHGALTLAGSIYFSDFNGLMDEARVLTFAPGEPVANIIASLQAGSPCTAFVSVGGDGAVKQASLSPADTSIFRMGGAVRDVARVIDANGLSVAGAAPQKHLIQIAAEGPISAGRYPLIHYSGTIGGQGFAGLELAPLPGRTAATLEINSSTSTIDLVVGASQGITWTGTASNQWDSTTGNNWVLDGSSTPAQFLAQDKVTFNASTAAMDNSVVIPNAVSPFIVNVEGSENYTFSGASITGNTTLTKTGNGTLTLANDNTFSGASSINGGTLRLGNGGSTGSLGSGPLALNNSQLLVERNGEVALATGAFSGSGTITIGKSGSGRLILPPSNSTSNFTGQITISSGELVSRRNKPFSNADLTIAAGACLDTAGLGLDNKITVSGHGVDGQGALKTITGAGIAFDRGFELTGDTTISGGGAAIGVRGPFDSITRRSMTGNHKLTIRNGGLGLTLADFHIKDLDIENGSLNVGEGTVISGSPADVITLRNGNLHMSAPYPLTQYPSYVKPTCSKSIVLHGGTLSVNGAFHSYVLPGNIQINGGNNTLIAEFGHPPVSPPAAMAPVSLTVNGTVSGNGSLTTDGYGSVSLTQAPAYTGDTTVLSRLHSLYPQYIFGYLSLSAPGLADTSAVTIGNGARLVLNFTGNDTVAKLSYGGIQLPAGVYPSAGIHAGGGVGGSGTLTVTSGPSDPPYRQWETLHGIVGAGAGADSDHDGINNGVEFVLGGDPSGPDSNSRALLPVITSTGGNLQIVYRRHYMSILAGDPGKVKYGSGLGSDWTTAQHGVDGVTIVTEPDAFGIGIDRVTVTIPKAGKPKLFARLQADVP